jgi:hypothetical protein
MSPEKEAFNEVNGVPWHRDHHPLQIGFTHKLACFIVLDQKFA